MYHDDLNLERFNLHKNWCVPKQEADFLTSAIGKKGAKIFMIFSIGYESMNLVDTVLGKKMYC